MVLREYWVGEYQKRVRPGKGYSTRTRTEIDEGVRRGGLEERLIERSKQKKKKRKEKTSNSLKWLDRNSERHRRQLT